MNLNFLAVKFGVYIFLILTIYRKIRFLKTNTRLPQKDFLSVQSNLTIPSKLKIKLQRDC